MKKHLFIFVCFGSLLLSCAPTRVESQLLDVESYIMERPDSALNVLESMDIGLLVTEEDRAHHALRHSIALDKNYIDLTNDSIIAPAVTYYMNHGSAKEKLLVNYYRGVIYSNAGEAERAMKSYLEAENYIDECNDYGLAARLYTAKMSLYRYSYDFIEALDQERIAASYFLKDNDTINYIHSLNDIANLNLLLSNYNESYQALVLIKSLWEYLDAYQKSRYFTNLLHLSRADSTFNTESVINDYLAEKVVCNYVNWIDVANAYISISDYTSAYDAVKKYRDDGGAMNAAYYWTAALVYDGLGDFQNSVISFKEYNAIIGKEIVAYWKVHQVHRRALYEGTGADKIKTKHRAYYSLPDSSGCWNHMVCQEAEVDKGAVYPLSRQDQCRRCNI